MTESRQTRPPASAARLCRPPATAKPVARWDSQGLAPWEVDHLQHEQEQRDAQADTDGLVQMWLWDVSSELS
jgi:hypothetical protein